MADDMDDFDIDDDTLSRPSLHPVVAIVLGIVIVIAVVLIATRGCTADYGGLVSTSVKSILDNPRRYEGRIVKVSGVARDSVGIFGQGAFVLDDGTGQITVITNRGVPAAGERVVVRGRVQTAAVVGTQRATVIMELRR